LVPWRDRTLIGTAYRKFAGEPGRKEVTEVDLRNLLEDCNQAYPGLELSWDDVTFYHAGVLPLQGEGRNGAGIPLASEPRILDHGREAGLEGLISIIGVKYTTARLVAEQAIDLVFRKLGRTPPRDSMEGVSIWGGEETAQGESPPCATAEAVHRLREAYGSRGGEVALLYRDESGWDTPIAPGCTVLRCEVFHAVREEMAVKLSDVVLRRTDLGTAGCPARSQIDAVARIMGQEMGWTREREVQEVGEVLKSYAVLPLREVGA